MIMHPNRRCSDLHRPRLTGGNASYAARRHGRRGLSASSPRSTRSCSKHLYNDEGKLRCFVNIYLNDEDIRYLAGEDTAAGERRRD